MVLPYIRVGDDPPGPHDSDEASVVRQLFRERYYGNICKDRQLNPLAAASEGTVLHYVETKLVPNMAPGEII